MSCILQSCVLYLAVLSPVSSDQRLAEVRGRREAEVKLALAERGLSLGNQVYLRVFKESSELEVWMEPAEGEPFVLYKTLAIVRWSGTLGPKHAEGDLQAPEGCYAITQRQLNPASSYHLSMNIGYPNDYDLAMRRTGSLIMIHGKNVSTGCFAMSDPVIEELYLLVHDALEAGQRNVLVHCFPFRFSDERMAAAATQEAQWLEFWKNLREVWAAFEPKRRPPKIAIVDKRYLVRE